MLSVLLARAGPVDLVMAASSQREQLDRCRVERDGSGVVFVLVPEGPDGADLALLAYAARCPAGEMVVVSHDWRFARLVEAGHRIVVLARRPEQVAKRLAAEAVRVLQFDPPPVPPLPWAARPRAMPGDMISARGLSVAEERRQREEAAYTAEFRRALADRRREPRPRRPDALSQRRCWREALREWGEDVNRPGVSGDSVRWFSWPR